DFPLRLHARVPRGMSMDLAARASAPARPTAGARPRSLSRRPPAGPAPARALGPAPPLRARPDPAPRPGPGLGPAPPLRRAAPGRGPTAAGGARTSLGGALRRRGELGIRV